MTIPFSKRLAKLIGRITAIILITAMFSNSATAQLDGKNYLIKIGERTDLVELTRVEEFGRVRVYYRNSILDIDSTGSHSPFNNNILSNWRHTDDGGFYISLASDSIREVVVSNIHASEIDISSGFTGGVSKNYNEVKILSCHARNITLRNAKPTLIVDSGAGWLTLRNCLVDSRLEFQRNVWSYISFEISDIMSLIVIQDSLRQLNFFTSTFHPGADIRLITDGMRSKLSMSNIEGLENLEFNYRQFSYVPRTGNEREESERHYEIILDIQKQQKHTLGAQLIDKEARKFKSYNANRLVKLFDSLNEWWWDYGYHPEWVFKNSLVLMLIAFGINLLFYQYLVSTTYPITGFTDAHQTMISKYAVFDPRRIIAYIVHCFLYTVAIFWGIKLDLGKLSLKYLMLALIVISEYSVGLICLAYFANYIIVKGSP